MSFSTLLVANRGEIARRVIRGARAMGIRTVAVYVDADAQAPFVADADEAVRLPESYLDGKAIIEAAQATSAEARTVMPSRRRQNSMRKPATARR